MKILGTKPSFMQENQVLLSAEPSLQPDIFIGVSHSCSVVSLFIYSFFYLSNVEMGSIELGILHSFAHCNNLRSSTDSYSSFFIIGC